MPKTALVTGASGFVGSHLARALVEAGHDVRAMTRHPDDYDGAGTAVFGDVEDAESLARAMAGADVAYYLVHALESDDFEKKDAANSRRFGAAATDAGLDRIVYLGGLGDESEDLSAHLRSRRQVETLLGEAGTPVTVLRAAVVVGHGGISWEMTRQLVHHLPVMITPKWVNTRTQPIALDDVVRYLVGVLDHPDARDRVFEIGGADVLRYIDMLTRVAKQVHRPMLTIPVPLLSPSLSSRWLALVTDVDHKTARNLVDSMTNEVVVRDDSIKTVVPGEPLGYDEAVRRALAAREQAEDARRGRDTTGATST